MSFFGEKHILYSIPEQGGNLEGKGQARVVFAGFNRIDGLSRDIELTSEVGLRPLTLTT